MDFANDAPDTAWRNRLVECALEGGFIPEPGVLTSFLVNALYLFGGNSIAAHGGAPGGVTDELTRLGHRVSAAGAAPRREGRHDRAVALDRAFGRGEDREILDRLRELRRALRPGGLLCFHVFDRDRAWDRAGERAVAAEGRSAKVRIGFDPATGRLSARLVEAASGWGGFLAVKAWNRLEIESLLRSAGLKPERIYGDWDGSGPESAATGRLIVVAAKPRRARGNARKRAIRNPAAKPR